MIKSMQFPASYFLDEANVKRFLNSGFRAAAISMNETDLGGTDWKDHIKAVREALDKNGITCVQTHLASYDILRSSDSMDDETDEIIRRSVEATPMLGAKWGAFHPRAGHAYGYDVKKEVRDNKIAIEKLLDTAAKFGAGIAVENIPIFPDCPQYKFFTSDINDHIGFVDLFDPELVGICWDTGHANLMPYDQCEMIRSLGSRLKIVHLHNNNKQVDEHNPPSLGYIDFSKVMPAILSTGFDGSIMLEAHHTVTQRTEATYLAHCYDCACWLEDLCR